MSHSFLIELAKQKHPVKKCHQHRFCLRKTHLCFLENVVLLSRKQVLYHNIKHCEWKITFFLPWNRAVFLPFVATCLFLMTAVWVGGEWLLSVNTADHHTSSHMPASMIDGCSLSWTKWKVHAFESDKGLVCLCVFNWCVSVHLQREFSSSPSGSFYWKCTLTLQRHSPMWLAERIWIGVTWPWALHARMHTLTKRFHSVFPSTGIQYLCLFIWVHFTLQHDGPDPFGKVFHGTREYRNAHPQMSILEGKL